jgi:hypothetical protein
VGLDDIVDAEKLAAKNNGESKKKKSLLSTLLSDLSKIKYALGSAVTTFGVDRYLTYLGLKTKQFLEFNPGAISYMVHFGEVPGMIINLATNIGLCVVWGKVLEAYIFDDKAKRNSLIKTTLYGAAACEFLVDFSNYLALKGYVSTPLTYLSQHYGIHGIDAIFYAAWLLPAIAYGAYQSIKKQNRSVQIKTAAV